MDLEVGKILDHILGADKVAKLSKPLRCRLINVLTLYLFSHRYNKSDDYLIGLKEDVSKNGDYISFDLIRVMLYKYSKKAQKKFMTNPLLAFLLTSFLSSEEALEFIKNTKMNRMDTNEFNQIKYDKIMEEINDFKKQANEALRKSKDADAKSLIKLIE